MYIIFNYLIGKQFTINYPLQFTTNYSLLRKSVRLQKSKSLRTSVQSTSIKSNYYSSLGLLGLLGLLSAVIICNIEKRITIKYLSCKYLNSQ
jgi:hypothetical protein